MAEVDKRREIIIIVQTLQVDPSLAISFDRIRLLRQLHDTHYYSFVLPSGL